MSQPAPSVAALLADHPRLIPVLHVENPEHAEPLLEALVGAGVMALEVTLRSACALEVIGRMQKMHSGAIVGAGTITRADQLGPVVDAGAQFGVSPALTPRLSEAVQHSGLPFLPGCATPSEVLFAREEGFSELKFFPADLFGGIGFLNHVLPLFPEMRFCPTGGISDANSRDYLALRNVLAVGGAFLAPRNVIEAADWQTIKDKAARSVAVVTGRA